MNFVLHGTAVSAGITIGHAHLVSSARLEAAHYEIPETAVQGEIFYGIKTVVTAFSFLDREKGEMVRMYEPAAAQQVEEELRQQLAKDGVDSLCTGGSSYSNIFGGGVDLDEAHFCASSLGWGSALRWPVSMHCCTASSAPRTTRC